MSWSPSVSAALVVRDFADIKLPVSLLIIKYDYIKHDDEIDQAKKKILFVSCNGLKKIG